MPLQFTPSPVEVWGYLIGALESETLTFLLAPMTDSPKMSSQSFMTPPVLSFLGNSRSISKSLRSGTLSSKMSFPLPMRMTNFSRKPNAWYFVHLSLRSHHSFKCIQMRRGHSAWLHKFAFAAEKALLAEFDLQNRNTVEQRSEFVRSILGDPVDMSKKHRPFLWKSAYEESAEDKQPTVCSALLQV